MTELQSNPKITSNERVLKSLVSIAITLLLVIGLYFVVTSLPLEMIGEVRSKGLEWRLLPLIALLQIVFMFLAAEIWRRIVQMLAGTRITLWSAYVQLAIVAVGKYVPGKVWGFIGRIGEMYRKQIPIHLSVTSSVLEQLLVANGALLVTVIAALIALPQHRAAVCIVGGLLFLVTIAMMLKIPEITKWVLRRRKIQDFPEKIPNYNAKGLLGFTLAYAVLWILSGLIFCVIYFSLFDVPVSGEFMAALTLANTVGIMFGFFVFFVPGGIGVREAVATGILAGFMPIGEALLAAVSYRAWMVLIDGLNAVLILIREMNLTNPRCTDDRTSQHNVDLKR